MPSNRQGHRLSTDAVARVVRAACFSPKSAPQGAQIGLEIEFLPVKVDAGGRPAGRLQLYGRDGALAIVDGLAAHDPTFVLPRDSCEEQHHLADGGALTYEPGGQIEFSGPPCADAAAALRSGDRVTRRLAEAFRSHDVVLAGAGMDVWTPPGEVGQQLRAPRYPAMDAYLSRRGPAGATMMRHTASLHLNLELDAELRRWELANLVSPLIVATFACSPAMGMVSRRAAVWQQVDPTRTGLPAAFLHGVADPVAQLTAAAMSADVLLFGAEAGASTPGRPGFTFWRWIQHGDATHGWPTEDDLRYHLTTLFHDVRPRNWLEIRNIDALPSQWRAAPVMLLTGLLCDPVATAAATEVLRPYRSALQGLRARAGTRGLADPTLAELAAVVWPMALAGAWRSSNGDDAGELGVAQDFLGRFVRHRRCPADDLADLLAADPRAALRWAAEPNAVAVKAVPAVAVDA